MDDNSDNNNNGSDNGNDRMDENSPTQVGTPGGFGSAWNAGGADPGLAPRGSSPEGAGGTVGSGAGGIVDADSDDE